MPHGVGWSWPTAGRCISGLSDGKQLLVKGYRRVMIAAGVSFKSLQQARKWEARDQRDNVPARQWCMLDVGCSCGQDL